MAARKMVVSCSVVGCRNRFEKGGKIKFFRFPRGKRQRAAWVRALNRKDFVPKEHSRVCSEHFVTGWPDYVDPKDVDFAPSVFCYKVKPMSNRRKNVYRRDVVKLFEDASRQQDLFLEKNLKASVNFHQYCKPGDSAQKPNSDSTAMNSHENVELMDINSEEDVPLMQSEGMSFSTKSIGVSTEDDLIKEIHRLREENSCLKERTKQLHEEINVSRWSIDRISNDDKATQLYTGLPTFAVLMWLFRYLEPKANRMTYWNGEKKTNERQQRRTGKLTLLDQLFSVLMRLKVGLFVNDIADRFGISIGTYSKIFNTWITLLNKELTALNPYPSKEMVQRYLPASFVKYPNTRIIIDCTEIFVDIKPSALSAQNETFSSNKHHDTVKFLVGISPGGVFTFISKAWDGRVSDREIVKGSGLLELIEPGDNILADKGFTIQDLLREKQAFLNNPHFLKEQAQFTPEQVEHTRDIAEVRIHVERAIGRMKNFHILDGSLPLSVETFVTDIVRVCAYLTNFSVPTVPRN